MNIDLESPIIIAYILFQIIVYVIVLLSIEGEKIRRSIKAVRLETYFIMFLLTTVPILNIIAFFGLAFGEDSEDVKIGFNASKNIFHYLVLALPVIALISLFFVEI